MFVKENETPDSFVRRRCREKNISIAELCRKADISRQTFYDLAAVPQKLPSVITLFRLAQVLDVHPSYLTQLVFQSTPIALNPQTQTHPRHVQDMSAFVRDVTYPDHSCVLPSQKFTKTWEMQNVGTTAWKNRYLKCMDDAILVYSQTGQPLNIANNLTPEFDRVAIPTTHPGETVQISVRFTTSSTPGTVYSYWKSFHEHGVQCFPMAIGLSCLVRVCSVVEAVS